MTTANYRGLTTVSRSSELYQKAGPRGQAAGIRERELEIFFLATDREKGYFCRPFLFTSKSVTEKNGIWKQYTEY